MHKFQKVETKIGKRQFHSNDSSQRSNSMSNNISGGLFQSKRSLIQRNTGPNRQFLKYTFIDSHILVRRIIVFLSFHSFSFSKNKSLNYEEQMQQMILILMDSLTLQSLIQSEKRLLTLLFDLFNPQKSFQTIIKNCNFSINGKQLRMRLHLPYQ